MFLPSVCRPPAGVCYHSRQSGDRLRVDLHAIDDCEIADLRKDVNIGAGLLIGYNFGPVDVKFIYANAFYSRDTVGSNTGSEFFLKTSFKLWSPEEAPKKALITR